MKADTDTDAGDGCELSSPTGRYRSKTLKHRVARAVRRASSRPPRVSGSKSSHHPVSRHVKYLAAKRGRDAREDSEKFVEHRYNSSGWQSFGKTRVPPQIGE
jgi:hypothetical protein